MTDLSKLHPAVIHALRTGELDQAHAAAAELKKQSGTRSPEPSPVRRTSRRQQPPVIDDDDDFYARFRSNPLGR